MVNHSEAFVFTPQMALQLGLGYTATLNESGISAVQQYEEENTAEVLAMLRKVGFLGKDYSMTFSSLISKPDNWGQNEPLSATVEFMGTAGAGKTTAAEFILNWFNIPRENYIPEQTKMLRQILRDEPFAKYLLSLGTNLRIGELAEYAREINFVGQRNIPDDPEWVYEMELEFFKRLGVQEWADRVLPMEEEVTPSDLVVVDRGYYDRIPFLRAFNATGRTSFWTDEMLDLDLLFSRMVNGYGSRGRRSYILVGICGSPDSTLSRKDGSTIVNPNFGWALYLQYLRFFGQVLSESDNIPFAFVLINSDFNSKEEVQRILAKDIEYLVSSSGLQRLNHF